MARAQKENQKNPGGAGQLKAPSAADRTLSAYKHTCLHCGGGVPCVPETLVAYNAQSATAGVASGGSAVAAQTADLVEAFGIHPAAQEAPGEYTDEELEELVSDEEVWREKATTASGD